MSIDPFRRDHAPPIGEAEHLAPGLRVVTAPNAGPMTFTGTRSYIVGEGAVAVIDPGPAIAAHLDALTAALRGERVVAVLVTHSHRDHSGGAAAFARQFGAPVLAHGDPVAARRPLMAALAKSGGIGGGEGLDADFSPDARLSDGETVTGPGWSLDALHTPGHLADHLSFQWGDTIFSGDLAMGWATTLISPPDGDLSAFRDSVGRLRGLAPKTLYPGHGAPVPEPEKVLAHLLAHRAAREAQIVAVLRAHPARIANIVTRLYGDVDPALHPAAARNVLAHLIDLEARGVSRVRGELGADATFEING